MVVASSQVGLRGAVDPELVMEVELSSWSWRPWRPWRVKIEAGRGTEARFSGLHDLPSCYIHAHTHTLSYKEHIDMYTPCVMYALGDV